MLTAKNIGYWYTHEDDALYRNVNLDFEAGKTYAIVGSSGSGKTTFLSLLAGLDTPSEGEILYEGQSLNKICLTNYRNQDVTIVFQSYNLFTYMSALDNVLTALAITKSKHKGDKDYALSMLNQIGLDEGQAQKNVQRLSGGQQQRVAIVRAMCCDAKLVVADEPTGNLDETNTKETIQLFSQLAHDQGKCVIIVTHEPDVAAMCDVQIELKNKQFTVQNQL